MNDELKNCLFTLKEDPEFDLLEVNAAELLL